MEILGHFSTEINTRKLVAILASDVVGFSRLAGADEDRTLARLRTLRSDLIDPTIAVHNGRVVKRTGDGAIVEFRSVVDAVRCAIEVQNSMVERNAGLPEDRRIVFRIGIHVGDVVQESDGDLMGDGVNIAARLEGMAKPGAICLSEQAYWQVKGRLDLAVTDLGATRLKNIAEPVRAYSLEVGVPGVAKVATEAKPPQPKKRSMFAPLVAGIVALVIIAGVAWHFLAGNRAVPTVATVPAPPEAAHLSIVVLPFTNLSNDPAQDYFADGVTENLTTDLSRIRGSFVIARNTAFTFKGKGLDAKEIGKALDVRYVLEGSVQRDASRVRINAQLIDAQSGAHLWADRFDENLPQLFALQDKVVARLANALHYEMINADAAKALHATNPDAIDFVMRGMSLYNLALGQSMKDKIESFRSARSFFNQALELDPTQADALAGNAGLSLMDFWLGWERLVKNYDIEIIEKADRAIALTQSLLGFSIKAYYLGLSGRPDEAIRVADKGIEVNSNYADLYAARAHAETALLRFDMARVDLNKAMLLSPRDEYMLIWQMMLGDVEFGAGDTKAAIELYRKAYDGGYRNYDVFLNLASAYALDGKMEEAKSSLAEARRLNPLLNVKWSIEHTMNLPRRTEGMRKAGLPDE
jgi:adenylate cyclase